MRAREVLAFNTKRLRKAAGYKSSAAFAEAVGLSAVTLARVESSGGWVDEATIAAIARALNVEESELLLDPGLTKPSLEQLREGVLEAIDEKLRTLGQAKKERN